MRKATYYLAKFYRHTGCVIVKYFLIEVTMFVYYKNQISALSLGETHENRAVVDILQVSFRQCSK